MISINDIRKDSGGILALGAHAKIIQSILDFDYLCGKKDPSVVGIITGNRRSMKLFFGTKEILVPCYARIADMPASLRARVSWMLNMQSGRRAYAATKEFFDAFPDARGGHIFAENVPEAHASELARMFDSRTIVAGPSGVGLIVPGVLKVGAIGGTDAVQLTTSHLTTPGSVAVVSTSGGMTNELLRAVSAAGRRVSFSISIGGDRFPVTSLSSVLMLAQEDPATLGVCYFGELGGADEYEIVSLITSGKLTKPVVAYVAGIIDESFDEHMQFGHAKALVARQDESARAKRAALRAVGVKVGDTFEQFLTDIATLPQAPFSDTVQGMDDMTHRRASILSTRTVVDVAATVPVVKDGALTTPEPFALGTLIGRALLGKDISREAGAFIEQTFALLIDHGGNVSGAVNAMITARAGKDMVSSLATGLLTVGPRFGGAMNTAAQQWIDGVRNGVDAAQFVEKYAQDKKLLAGIGHKKYRVGMPDPRVEMVAAFATLLSKHPHYDFARAVEEVTTGKNGKLILNVDGIIPALLLDILIEKDGFSESELDALVREEFFNALFVIPRTVGFIAHIMEQKKNDEGLFRLPDELLFTQGVQE